MLNADTLTGDPPPTTTEEVESLCLVGGGAAQAAKLRDRHSQVCAESLPGTTGHDC